MNFLPPPGARPAWSHHLCGRCAASRGDKVTETKGMDERERTELEAAAFRGLVQHLRQRTDVQNIDLMTLAGFCRNCLSKWYLAAARERGVALGEAEAKEAVYGMPYDEWRKHHQKEATAAQQDAYERSKPLHAVIDIPPPS